MTPGQLQRNSFDGKLQRDKTTGKIRRAKNSSQFICCCAAGCPCSGGGALPDTISVTFSGVVIPTTCLVYAEFFNESFESQLNCRFSESWKFVSVPINAKFCLTRIANTCGWTATVPAEVDWWTSASVANNTFPLGGNVLCECGSDYYGSCAKFVYDTLRVNFSVTDVGSGPVGNLTASISASSRAGFPDWAPFDFVVFGNVYPNYLLGGYFTPPCSGTVTVSNMWTYFRTYYFIDHAPGGVGSELITDPGGSCKPGIDVPCPTSNGVAFGGSALVDTTGAPCP